MAAARQRLLPRFALTAVAAAALIIAVGRAHAADPAAGSLVMGPQAMEGDLKVSPGTTLLVGYDFTIPGRHPDTTVGVWGASVTFQASCVSGAGGGTVVVPLPDATYTDPQDSSDWYPSGDQHDPLVYQGATSVPDLCGGGLVRFRQGGTFTATVVATDTSHKVNVRWHYSANDSSGSWSGTKSVVPAPISVNPEE